MPHTPGPWETSRDAVPADHVQITVYAESDGERVATVFRDAANASLIAAAPELLEFVENLRDLHADGLDVEVLAEVMGDYCGKLLAKAKGG